MITSDSGIFLWYTYQTLTNMGVDANAIFAGIGLPPEAPDKSIRRDNSTQTRFWHIAQNISLDTDIGLHVGENFPIFRGDILEYLFLSSPTFGEGLQRVLRYQNILTNAIQLELSLEKHQAKITGFEHPVRHYLECAISIFLKILSELSKQTPFPQEIWLRNAKGASLSEYQRIWKCPTRLGMPENCIFFDANILNLPSVSAQPTLLKLHEQVAAQELKLVEKYQLINQIEKLFSEGLLELGDINLSTVAKQLNMSARTLRAHLQDIDSSFEKVLATYRQKTAKKLLSNPNISLDQIVYLLGFSEISAFSRAFKRWTGETPSNYRQRKQL